MRDHHGNVCKLCRFDQAPAVKLKDHASDQLLLDSDLVARQPLDGVRRGKPHSLQVFRDKHDWEPKVKVVIIREMAPPFGARVASSLSPAPFKLASDAGDPTLFEVDVE